jgi:molybdate transport repressor ModE-like protein
MLDHVKLGLTYLQDKCDQVLITHVGVPLFTAQTVQALLDGEGDVRVPAYGGQGGHPLLLRASVFPQVLSYEGPDGLRGATRSLARTLVPVEDAGVVTNVRRDQVDEGLLKNHDLARLHPDFDVRLMRERVFYDSATHQLLRLTEETGSLLDACRHMGVSYTKGRAIIARLERQLGQTVLQSRQGGRDGGGSQVTEAGRQLMERYDAFRREAETYLTELFYSYFPD